MYRIGSTMNEQGITNQEGRSTWGRMSRRGYSRYDETIVYKSKNLEAERRRRQKLSDGLLALRAVVPIITNMNKATIIEDAITYIQELQRNVKVLSDMVLEMEDETSSSEEGTKKRVDEMDASEEVKQCGIKEDFQVTIVEGNKLWMTIILEKKSGFFTRLIEKLTCFGLELTDTSFTTSKGATRVSACVEGADGDTLTVQQTKELLLQIIREAFRG